MKYEIKVNDEAHTIDLGKKLGSLLFPQALITLEGDLGAGKTTFTKGIAQGLGVTKTVNSPTFTIIKEYKGNLPLYHMDLYRINNQFEDLGFDDYFFGEGVTVLEWASHIEEQLPNSFLNIKITTIGEEQRLFSFYPIGVEYIKLCEVLFNE